MGKLSAIEQRLQRAVREQHGAAAAAAQSEEEQQELHDAFDDGGESGGETHIQLEVVGHALPPGYFVSGGQHDMLFESEEDLLASSGEEEGAGAPAHGVALGELDALLSGEASLRALRLLLVQAHAEQPGRFSKALGALLDQAAVEEPAEAPGAGDSADALEGEVASLLASCALFQSGAAGAAATKPSLLAAGAHKRVRSFQGPGQRSGAGAGYAGPAAGAPPAHHRKSGSIGGSSAGGRGPEPAFAAAAGKPPGFQKKRRATYDSAATADSAAELNLKMLKDFYNEQQIAPSPRRRPASAAHDEEHETSSDDFYHPTETRKERQAKGLSSPPVSPARRKRAARAAAGAVAAAAAASAAGLGNGHGAHHVNGTHATGAPLAAAAAPPKPATPRRRQEQQEHQQQLQQPQQQQDGHKPGASPRLSKKVDKALSRLTRPTASSRAGVYKPSPTL